VTNQFIYFVDVYRKILNRWNRQLLRVFKSYHRLVP